MKTLVDKHSNLIFNTLLHPQPMVLVLERQSLTGELSLACTGPAADW